ncbi:MAG TPA: hypothetical protein VK081_11400, partial [Planctomycetota bacterium]|nr:hypothetical protein [Planctomycetota bacterium]
MAPARTALPVACALLAGAAVAQQPSSPQGPPAPATAPRCYDFVAAMVGNKAILASQVTDWWRERMKEDEQRPRGTAAKPHALWGYLLEALITREIEAQSARLIGRAPDEIEALVERLVQENINQQAESFGGLNAFARELGAIGRSMGSFAEEARADIMRSIAYYQGVLRELHDQRAMLATPKEMKALFDADPDRFHAPARVKVAFVRVAHGSDPAAAAAQAEATAARWRELPRPVDEAALRERGADVLEIVPDRETTPALR